MIFPIRCDIEFAMNKFVLGLSLLFSLGALADEYGATALGVVKNMDLKKINEEAEAKDLEERKKSADVPRSYRVSPDNPHYKHQNTTPGQAPFFQNNDPQ